MSYAERAREAAWHELWVKQELNLITGWQAEPYGQALLSEDMRRALRRCRTLAGRKAPVRWMPDIIAVRSPEVRFIDAKAGQKWEATGNHDIEADALQAALRWSDALSADVWFIFTDGRGVTARRIGLCEYVRPGRFAGNGSGTPFWLLPRAICAECIRPTPPTPADWAPPVGTAAVRATAQAAA